MIAGPISSPSPATRWPSSKDLRDTVRELELEAQFVVSASQVVRSRRAISGETSFEYDREVQPAPTRTKDRGTRGAAFRLGGQREQWTLIRIFEELGGRGYDGGYDAVRRYVRRWAKEHWQAIMAAYVALNFAPGKAYQFD